ncbi:MAG: hypothetical protein E7812_00895 [Phenylobacterium sp.]|nr:MAG: hypothetical protein E7812_00895 [Phenylobacterium sp.]
MTTDADNPDRVQTTAQAEREGVEGAVGAPLRDLNLLRTKIPAVLLESMSDPYYRPPGRLGCDDILALMAPLEIALGPDLDTPKDAEGMGHKGRGATLGAVAGAAAGAVPFHSWIRKLSGAERHDAYVQAAITAGGIRRGYLKGLGEARGCPPPATPSHVLTGAPIIDQTVRPRYPTRLPPPPPPGAATPPDVPPQ